MKRNVILTRLFCLSLLLVQMVFLSGNLNAQTIEAITPSDTLNILFGQQERSTTTYSISTINGEMVKNVPTLNRRNALTGLLPGLTVMQSNGEPGDEGGSMFIRGQRTLNANNTPWVVVDGIQRSVDMLEPDEIESVTILKDAAAIAIYGLRGSNGVILVTTKRGKANQKLKINFDARVAMQTSVKLPEFLGSYDYANLYNEALINDRKSPFYHPDQLEAYRTNSDPYKYPNNDYLDQYLKNHSIQQKYNLSAVGGTSNAKYYFLLGYTDNSGIYKVNTNTYGTNARMNQYSVRSNVDVQVNKNLDISIDLSGRMQNRTYPGMRSNSTSGIFSALCKTPPNAFPERYEGLYNIENSSGTVLNPLAGTTQYTNNPYGLLNNSGYSRYTSTQFTSNIGGKYKLDFITRGLYVNASFSYDSFYNKNVNRSKNFEVYELVDEDAKIVRQIGTPSKMASVWTPISSQNRLDFQFGFNYNRYFNQGHHVDAMVKYNYNKYKSDGTNLPNTNLGAIGRLHYEFSKKYIAEFSFSFTGTEQFPKGDRFGFFPAASLAWDMAKESFIEDNLSWVNMFKLRASHGLTGSDKGIPYFYYLENYNQGSSISLGTSGATPANNAWFRAMLGNTDITWEKNKKTNIGLDASFLDNKITLTADIFKERSYDILVSSGTMPEIFGNIIPRLNAGKVDNQGFELMLGYNSNVSEFNYFINANLAFTKSKIEYMDEQYWANEYRYLTGYPVGKQLGLIADGFFQSQEEIDASPSQSFYGTVRPGDIKYRDLNDDDKIDANDISRIGNGEMPNINYGINLGVEYKGFDISALLQGTAKSEAFITGFLAYEFPDNGNVMPHHYKRWAHYTDPFTGEVIDTRATASYPRLTIGEGNNNRQNSTFWLKDLSYLRLKTLEVGYSFDRIWETKYISKARLYLSGYNLFTFSDIDHVDPEMATSGFAYPIQRVFNVGINLTF